MKLSLLLEAEFQTPNRIVPSLRHRNCRLAVFLFDKATPPIFSVSSSAPAARRRRPFFLLIANYKDAVAKVTKVLFALCRISESGCAAGEWGDQWSVK